MGRQLPSSAGDDDMHKSTLEVNAEEYLGPADALRLLRDTTVDSEAPAEVQNRIWARISKLVLNLSNSYVVCHISKMR